MDIVLLIVVATALFFDFTNGFHDTANAVSTIVATKAVSPRIAVMGAAILNFIGAFISLHVAATIAGGIVRADAISLPIIMAGLTGAIIWNLITWRAGIPSSSSHALVGGIIGASIVASGWNVVQWSSFASHVLIPSLLSPFIGLAVAFAFMIIVIAITNAYPHKQSDSLFRRIQLASGGLVALMHGTNDAQKTMGIIALALLTVSVDKTLTIPLWVIIASATAMAAGTWLGGWRIIHTMGEKITRLDPAQGFAAQTSTAATLAVASQLGFPVSTTQTISGSIVGVGVAKKAHVNWATIKRILVAWCITIPSVALLSAGTAHIAILPNGVGVLLLIMTITGITIYTTRDWTRESRDQMRVLLALLIVRKR